jgi:hypothetical protein
MSPVSCKDQDSNRAACSLATVCTSILAILNLEDEVSNGIVANGPHCEVDHASFGELWANAYHKYQEMYWHDERGE